MFQTRHLVITLVSLLMLTTSACGDDQEPVDNLFLKVTADADVSDLSQLRLLFKQGTTKFPADLDTAEFNPLLTSLDPRVAPVYLSIRYNATTFADPNVRMYVSGLGASGVAAVFHGSVNLSQAEIIDVHLRGVSTDCDIDTDGFVDCDIAGCCAGEEPLFSDCDPSGNEPSINPWAVEPACKACNSPDQDCSGDDVACVDGDGDGFADCVEVEAGCDPGADTSAPGKAEICDTLDNDCDGSVDEDFAVTVNGELLQVGDSCGLGDCAGGIVVCAGGTAACSNTPAAGQQEICGNTDDEDCDGDVDEGCAGDLDGDGFTSLDDCNDFDSGIYPGRPNEACCPAGEDLAACDTNCDNSTTPCPAGDLDGDGFTVADGDCDDTDPLSYPEAVERCGDGIDQDCFGGDVPCEGLVDADGDGWSPPLDCDDNDDAINPQGSETDNPCDGVDNNCDGDVDNGNPGGGAECGTDVGECQVGLLVCSQSNVPGVICIGSIEPTDEVCDGKDNDCDGTNDNGFDYEGIAVGQSCDGMGECGGGTVECAPGTLQVATCSTNPDGSEPQVMPESCDNLDNDCDGDTDEEVPEDLMAADCTLDGQCTTGVTASCDGDGTWTCDYTGVADYEADETRCDGLDNDCDGGIDEGFPTLGLGCDGDDADSCESGTIQCTSLTATGCVESPDTVVVETCDGIDNDCDLEVDEGFSVAETADPDGDGEPNCFDQDDDGDGAFDVADNCPLTSNADQLNTDGADDGGNACDDDDDDDGTDDGLDNCPLVFNVGQTNTDTDDDGDACDDDDDNDGIEDVPDNCQFVDNTDQLNTDGDTLGDACDEDDDGDGVLDATDNCPLLVNADQLNTDGSADGGDVCDPDDDDDTVTDTSDNCPLVFNTDQANLDGDLLGDDCDDDDDGDGTNDDTDNCPIVANDDQADLDSDGFGDLCDDDDDGDGVGDAIDNCPLISNADQTNTDGAGDGGDACDDDDDDDGFNDDVDNCPLTFNAGQTNVDGEDDGGDACDDDDDDDGDNFPDVSDNCPLVPSSSQNDADSDGLGDVCDDDIDGDTVLQQAAGGPTDACIGTTNPPCYDNCPTKPNPDQANQDGDTLGDECDDDIDGDGIGNSSSPPCGSDIAPGCADNCPLASNATQLDDDFDGIGNACDNCPLVSNGNQADADSNGVGDACEPTDVDTDGVFVTNGLAACVGGATTNCSDNCPDDANPNQEDDNDNGVGDACEVDDDADDDGVVDGDDNCVNDPNPGQEDWDSDGVGDLCDACPLGSAEPFEVGGDCIDNDCTLSTDDTSTVERSILTVKVMDAVPAGYAVSIEFDHAASVAAGAMADGSDLLIYHRNPATGGFTQLNRVLDPVSSWNSPNTKVWFALVNAMPASMEVDDEYFLYVQTTGVIPREDEDAVFHFADFFERADSNAIGNGWIEDEPNAPVTRIVDGGIEIRNPGNAAYQPRLQHSMGSVTTGTWRWRYGFDWDMVGVDDGVDDIDYAVFTQIGDASKFNNDPSNSTDRAGTFHTSMWQIQQSGNTFVGHNWLYYLTENNFIESYGPLAGFHDMTVDANLGASTNLLSIDGDPQIVKPRTDPAVDALNAVRFLGHRLNTGQLQGDRGRIEYVLVRPLVSIEPSVGDDTMAPSCE